MENNMAKNNEAEVQLAHESHAPVYDLANRISRSTVAVVDTMVQRGAIKGEELTTLGQLRDQAVQMIQMCETYQTDQAANS
jgi:hypothetical protein